MKKAFIGIALTTALTSGALAEPAFQQRMIQTQMLEPVVQIGRNCSAVLVYSGPAKDEDQGNVTYGLTAKHCATKTSTEDIIFPVYRNNRLITENVYKASYYAKYPKHDLAVVKLLDDVTVFDNVADLASEDITLYEGEEIYVAGYPLGRSRTLTRGAFANIEEMDFPSPGTLYFRTSAQVAGGNSGGALYHRNYEKARYELIGITSVRNKQEGFMSYYVPLESIHDFLSKSIPEFKVDKKDK